MEQQFLSGVIEGFYGRPWTSEQRIKLFARLKKFGLNTYLYAPKDDTKHRVLWRELYNVEEIDVLSTLIDAANRENIDFVYALSPGLDMAYSSTADINCLKRKLDQVQRLGCRSFALLFDDIKNELRDTDKDNFQSLALAQVSVTNKIYQHLNQPHSFFFCPTEYCASRARPNLGESTYLNTIGSKLLPPIDIMWTGPKVVSRKISIQSIEEVAEVLQRPPLIWDNIHANDYDYSRMFLGPFEGRSSELRPYIRGILTNPNREFEANFIALHTLSQWTKCSMDSVMKKDTVPRMTTVTDSPRPRSDPSRGRPWNCTSRSRNCPSRGRTNTSVPRTSKVGYRALRGLGRTRGFDHLEAESPLPTEVLQLETDGDFVLDEDSLSHCCTHPYIPRQALKFAISEWHDEFMVKCNAPDDLLQSYLAPLIVPPPTDASLPKSSDMAPFEFTETDFPATVTKQETSLPSVLPSADEKSHTIGGEPMDCCITVVPNGSLAQLSSQDDDGVAGETMQIDSDASTPVAVTAMTLEDITLLVDLFYMPFEYGQQTVDLLNEFEWIISNIGHREWTERQSAMIERLNLISAMIDRVCDIPNRAIFAEVYPYLWASKVVISILVCFVQWLGLGKVPSTCQCIVHGPATWSNQEYQYRLSSGEYEPWLTKGGVIRELQKMLPLECNSDLHIYSCPCPSDAIVFTVRPYRPSDKAAIFTLFKRWCNLCNNNNMNTSLKDRGLHLEVFAEIMVGSFLHQSPEFCFVVEDSRGALCAYVLGALDAASYFEKVTSYWVPEVIGKYKGVVEKDVALPPEEVMQQLESYKTCLLDNQMSLYPSLLRVEFDAEFLLDRSAVKRAIACAVAALKINGSCGVYTRVPILHPSLMEIYFNIGLFDIGYQTTGAKVLGRSISVLQPISSGYSPSSTGNTTSVTPTGGNSTAKWCHTCNCCNVV